MKLLNRMFFPRHPMLDSVAGRMVVVGKQQYADDLVMEGMLVWESPLGCSPSCRDPRAWIFLKLRHMPGVRCVITAKDIPGKNQSGIVIRDQPAIAEKKVIYIGDSVASVFADTPEIAIEALSKNQGGVQGIARGLFTD